MKGLKMAVRGGLTGDRKSNRIVGGIRRNSTVESFEEVCSIASEEPF